MHPFTTDSADSLANLNETALIQKLKSWLGTANPPAPEGIGDDCAVIKNEGAAYMLSTTDAVVYGRHFDATVTPQDAGRKLVNRNLSDIAAMGGQPKWGLISLLLPQNLSQNWLQQFYAGIQEAARYYNITINGGDICKCEHSQFTAYMTLLGSTEKYVERTTAEVGHSLWVTGDLGGSLLGKHYNFTPRLKEGQWLAEQSAVSAMMDITDGLGKDLPSLLPDGSVATLQLEAIPISDAAQEYAKTSGKSTLDHAFNDGEDYELLFTLGPGISTEDFLQRWYQDLDTAVKCIGQIVPFDELQHRKKYMLYDAQKVEALVDLGGYCHF